MAAEGGLRGHLASDETQPGVPHSADCEPCTSAIDLSEAMSQASIILCPGQGAQVVGMGRAWHDHSPEARAIFARADEVLSDRFGAKLSTLCFEGPPERLNRTDVSQPAIYVTSVACWRGLLATWGMTPGEARITAAAGLSLGEYTALHLAGCFDFEDGLEMVALRGQAMQDAAEASPSGMLALIGADESQAVVVCDQAREDGVLVCANFNAPGQVVLSGDKAAIERAVGVAATMGLRATPLPVAGAFHSPLMQPAAARLAEALTAKRFHEPRCPVVSNVTARPYAGAAIVDEIKVRLVEQLTAPVRWEASCRWLIGTYGGAEQTWLELAPGKTLAGLMRRIDKNVKVVSHDEPTR